MITVWGVLLFGLLTFSVVMPVVVRLSQGLVLVTLPRRRDLSLAPRRLQLDRLLRRLRKDHQNPLNQALQPRLTQVHRALLSLSRALLLLPAQDHRISPLLALPIHLHQITQVHLNRAHQLLPIQGHPELLSRILQLLPIQELQDHPNRAHQLNRLLVPQIHPRQTPQVHLHKVLSTLFHLALRLGLPSRLGLLLHLAHLLRLVPLLHLNQVRQANRLLALRIHLNQVFQLHLRQVLRAHHLEARLARRGLPSHLRPVLRLFLVQVAHLPLRLGFPHNPHPEFPGNLRRGLHLHLSRVLQPRCRVHYHHLLQALQIYLHPALALGVSPHQMHLLPAQAL